MLFTLIEALGVVYPLGVIYPDQSSGGEQAKGSNSASGTDEGGARLIGIRVLDGAGDAGMEHPRGCRRTCRARQFDKRQSALAAARPPFGAWLERAQRLASCMSSCADRGH